MTTIRIPVDPNLHKQVKDKAAHDDFTVSEVGRALFDLYLSGRVPLKRVGVIADISHPEPKSTGTEGH